MHQDVTDGPVLGAGIWLHIWIGAGNADPLRVLAEACAVGARGLVVHSVGAAKPSLEWIARARAPYVTALPPVEFAVGVGSLGPKKWNSALAGPAVLALGAGHRVMLDWEGAWDRDNGQAAAQLAVGKIVAAVPDAVGRVADDCWWAPLRTPGGNGTHPHAPTREFGALCATRYVQCYPDVGAVGLQPDGAALRMLAWARDPSQYPALGTPARAVFATVRGYARSVQDACTFALAEPHHVCYLGSRKDKPNQLTDEVRRGLIAAARIRAHGSPDVASYQRDAGLVPDGVLGPRTLSALGVP